MCALLVSNRKNNPLLLALVSRRLLETAAMAVLLLVGEAFAAELDSPEFLIKRMIAASSALNYEGVFVYQRGNHIDSMRILHRVNGETEFERLISLSGPQREVVRKGTQVHCLFSDDQEVMVGKIEPRDFLSFGLLTSVEEIAAHYRLKLAGRGRIAGQAALKINIIPIEDYRYAYQLAVDEKHGLLLKSAIYGSDGKVLEQVQFANISIGHEIPMRKFEPEISGEGFTWRTSENGHGAESPESNDSDNWRAEWLPAGFEMRNRVTQRYVGGLAPVSHLVYSDGLAMVSIFVEKRNAGSATPLLGVSSMGAVNALSKAINGHHITIVGEVPEHTLRKIADSVAAVK